MKYSNFRPFIIATHELYQKFTIVSFVLFSMILPIIALFANVVGDPVLARVGQFLCCWAALMLTIMAQLYGFLSFVFFSVGNSCLYCYFLVVSLLTIVVIVIIIIIITAVIVFTSTSDVAVVRIPSSV